MRNIFYCVVLIVSSLCVLGCGAKVKTEFVEGTVTYKGAPVEGADISFSPVDISGGASPAYGKTDAQGKYKIQTQQGATYAGTTPGEYKVAIAKTVGIPTGEKITNPMGEVYEVMRYEEVLPQAYYYITSTPLRATVTAGGPNKFDFDLEGNPPKK